MLRINIKLIYFTLISLLVVAQLTDAIPAGELPRYERGVLYLPNKAIALGKQSGQKKKHLK